MGGGSRVVVVVLERDQSHLLHCIYMARKKSLYLHERCIILDHKPNYSK